MKDQKIILTKSRYIQALRCPSLLWNELNRKHLKSPLSDQAILNIESGYAVEDEIKKVLDLNGVDAQDKGLDKSIKKTQEVMKENYEYIYEPSFTFIHYGIECYTRVDILKRNDDGSFDLWEVKSSSNIKKHQKEDLAFQYWVLKKAGLNIRAAYLVNLNTEYVKTTKENSGELFKFSDFTEFCNDKMSEVSKNIRNMKWIFKEKKELKSPLGSQCKQPYVCEFAPLCKKNINKDSIEKLARLSPKKRQALNDLGIDYIKDIPEEFELTAKQAIQRSVALTKKTYINKKSIRSHIAKLNYPLHYLDFETYIESLPPFMGTRPNQFITFQASIHSEKKSGKIVHSEFLHIEKNTDPRELLILFLIKKLKKTGSIVVYNKSFEIGRMRELSKDFPKYKKELDQIIERVWDLADIFNYFYYEHNFQGSYSIKKVLPVLVPECSYDALLIRNGDECQSYYRNLLKGKFRGLKHNKIVECLLEYCKLDTLAMVKILQNITSEVFSNISVKEIIEESII